MKKILVTLLAVAMVASLCGMMFVSAEATNPAAGKEVANAEDMDASITTFWVGTDLTDGKAEAGWEITWQPGQWFGYWWNAEATNVYDIANAPDGVAIPTIDLGENCTIESARVNMFLGDDMGILPAKSAALQVSADGETYTTVATVEIPEAEAGSTNVGWIELAPEAAVEGRYVRIEIVLGSYWCFIDEIEVYGTAAAGGDVEPPVDDNPPAADVQTYDKTLVEGEDGNYTCAAPYGFTWNINYVDGTIAGEDNTICTTQEAYAACNPNWAITIYAEKQADGTYVALQDAIVCPGSAEAAGITLGENQIAIVAHSAYSNPNGTNWEAKVVAMSVKAGDVFVINEEMTTVYAVIPGAENAPSDDTTTEAPVTGDAGILVFAILGVVAICGAAVTIKARG